jgi:hypothetical protein
MDWFCLRLATSRQDLEIANGAPSDETPAPFISEKRGLSGDGTAK